MGTVPKKITIVLTAFCFSGCATQSSYEPLVDTTSAADQEKFENDLAECVEYLESVEADGLLVQVAGGAAAIMGTAAGATAAGTTAAGGAAAGAALGVVGAAAIMGTAAGAKAAGGAAAGAALGVVGAAAIMGKAAGTTAAVAGTLLGAAISFPAAIVAGTVFAKNKADNEEEALKAQVLNQCLEDRGYSIVEEAIDLN